MKSEKIKSNNSQPVIKTASYALQKRRIERVREGIMGVVLQEKSHIEDLSGYIPAAKRKLVK
ncbi:hypothetical protein [Emticicia agri]|uniref:Uncharacterized protein n=1 Tax=Emticicia agri TaxID=2492393 RepID=A0A4Q5LVE4_9BACT|nr:hypothetical protein [Emticicia agri]RYU93642.1 hypothetical protein EWM59_21150 [Emticicia agri]